jgi:threonine/homoserine/homoserine lactone efflux protein
LFNTWKRPKLRLAASCFRFAHAFFCSGHGRICALAGAITPGPVNVLALRHGNGRAGAAFCYVLGASLSYALIVWLMGQSGQWLLRQPELLRWAPRICALYLLWLAWQLAKAPGDHGGAARQSAPASLPAGPGGAFVQGIAIQSLNPKAWLVALSGIGMFVAPLAAQQVSLPSALLLFAPSPCWPACSASAAGPLWAMH